ncbi:MAG: hypothetical protein GVY19_09760 [Bacteroidetes bacterium]|jgi:hypothetical protein|nr:hypothetical protein [Bacteroidota bacterium]
MKKSLLFCLSLIVLTAFYPVEDEPYLPEYKPVIVTRDVLESSIAYQQPRELEKPGRIYIKDDYIFINEKYKGVHVINNADSANPQKIGFIRIPGCLNMAIKKNTMYADNSVDLVAIDISDPENLSVVSREKNVFPEPVVPNDGFIPYEYEQYNRPKDTYIIDFIKQ